MDGGGLVSSGGLKKRYRVFGEISSSFATTATDWSLQARRRVVRMASRSLAFAGAFRGLVPFPAK